MKYIILVYIYIISAIIYRKYIGLIKIYIYIIHKSIQKHEKNETISQKIIEWQIYHKLGIHGNIFCVITIGTTTKNIHQSNLNWLKITETKNNKQEECLNIIRILACGKEMLQLVKNYTNKREQ